MNLASAFLLAVPAALLIGWVVMHSVDAHDLLESRVTALEIKVTKLMGGQADGS